jgi:hypothetical protein
VEAARMGRGAAHLSRAVAGTAKETGRANATPPAPGAKRQAQVPAQVPREVQPEPWVRRQHWPWRQQAHGCEANNASTGAA